MNQQNLSSSPNPIKMKMHTPSLLDHVVEEFKIHFNRNPLVLAQAPGRINLIGEHTDYNDGLVLPGAIDRNTIFALGFSPEPQMCEVHALDVGEMIRFDISDLDKMQTQGWGLYVLGVVAALQQADYPVRGFQAVFASTVPLGSGVSSSAALECSLLMACRELFDLDIEPFTIAKLGQWAEHHYPGVLCGLMDQFSSVMGKQDQLVCLDCRDLSYQYIDFPLPDYRFVLLNTNVKHSLSSSEYNVRKRECQEAVQLIGEAMGETFPSLREITLPQLQKHQEVLSGKQYLRAYHVITENARVMQMMQELARGNEEQIGSLMFASHYSLRDAYEVSCPELDFLVVQAENHPGVLGARMMGGGFGGCTINLVQVDQIADFISKTTEAYLESYGIQLTPITVKLADGAGIISNP